MHVLEVIQRSTAFLESRGIESPRLQVELILAHILHIPRLQLYLQFDRLLAADILDPVRLAVQRRGQRVPLQHILGSASFCGLEIEVSPDVLIPRPETELLAERAWTWLNHAADSHAEPLRTLDWGTGSGCIALALAAHHPSTFLSALDVSPACLDVARRNATRLGFTHRIEFVCADGTEPLPAGTRFHLIVSNPPYIPSAEIATLQPEVRDHDPSRALDGGPDGLDLYRRLATSLPQRLHPGGALILEFGDGQASEISQILAAAAWTVTEVHRDHSRRERYLVAQIPVS